MVGLVKLWGIVMVIAGAIYLVKPTVMKKVLRFWTKGKRIYLGGALSLLLGIIFLFAAPKCSLSWFVGAVGILAIVKGVLLLALKPKTTITITENFMHSPGETLRILSLTLIGIGVLFILAA